MFQTSKQYYALLFHFNACRGSSFVIAYNTPSSPCSFGAFHKWGYPKMDGLYWKHPIEKDDLGVPPFEETTNREPSTINRSNHPTRNEARHWHMLGYQIFSCSSRTSHFFMLSSVAIWTIWSCRFCSLSAVPLLGELSIKYGVLTCFNHQKFRGI